MPDFAGRKKKAWKEVALCPPLSAGQVGPARVAQEFSPPLAANFGPSPEGAAVEGAAGQGVCILRLCPPTRAWPGGRGRGARSWTGSLHPTPLAADFGPGSERQRGAQLDGEFASRAYASGRRFGAGSEPVGGCSGSRRSWTGSLHPTPLAADFGPGSEGAAEGRAAGQGVCILRLSPPTLGPVWRGQRRGGLRDGESEGP